MTLVAVRGAVRAYAPRAERGGEIRALDGVDLDIAAGEAVALVGVSGAGKSTLARAILGVETLDAGSVALAGRDLKTLRGADRRAAMRTVGAIFQDVYGALPPHRTVSDIVREPLEIHGRGGAGARDLVAELLVEVGLAAPRFRDRLPGELSGGERQRVALARALALAPSLLIADEPTSMLDAAYQAELLGLIGALRERHGLAVLFITHDLALAARLCRRIVVMDGGRIVEDGDRREVFARPRHGATVALLDAVRALRAPSHVPAVASSG